MHSNYKRFKTRKSSDPKHCHRVNRYPSYSHQPISPHRLHHRHSPRERLHDAFECLYERPIATPKRCESLYTPNQKKFSIASSCKPYEFFTCRGTTPEFVPLTHRLESSNQCSSPRFSVYNEHSEVKPTPHKRKIRKVGLCHRNRSREENFSPRHYHYFNKHRPCFDSVPRTCVDPDYRSCVDPFCKRCVDFAPRSKTRYYKYNKYNTQHNNKHSDDCIEEISQRLEDSLNKFHDQITNEHYKTFRTWPDVNCSAVSSCYTPSQCLEAPVSSFTDIHCLEEVSEVSKKKRPLKKFKMKDAKKKLKFDDPNPKNITHKEKYKNSSCNHTRDSKDQFVIPNKQKVISLRSSESTLEKTVSNCENQKTKTVKKSEEKKKKKNPKEKSSINVGDQAQTVLELQERINYLQTKQAVLNNSHSCWENLINGSIYNNSYSNHCLNNNFPLQSQSIFPEAQDFFNGASELNSFCFMPPNINMSF